MSASPGSTGSASSAAGTTDPGVAVLAAALRRPGRLGALPQDAPGRLVCVDGPAGSGKTTLAEALVSVARHRGLGIAAVHVDDVLRGWGGLEDLGPRLHREVVDPLVRGEAGRYRRWDWHAGALAEEREVPPSDLVVVEGVGSGHPAYAAHVTLLVWVEAPADLRRRRGIARDGPAVEPHWDAFVAAEQRLHAAERTRARADLLVDGTSGAVVGH